MGKQRKFRLVSYHCTSPQHAEKFPPSGGIRKLRPTLAVELDSQAHQAAAGFADTPAARMGNLGHNVARVQAFEQSADGSALSQVRLGVGTVQCSADVLVAEAASY